MGIYLLTNWLHIIPQIYHVQLYSIRPKTLFSNCIFLNISCFASTLIFFIVLIILSYSKEYCYVFSKFLANLGCCSWLFNWLIHTLFFSLSTFLLTLIFFLFKLLLALIHWNFSLLIFFYFLWELELCCKSNIIIK